MRQKDKYIAISMHEIRLHSPLVVVMDGATVTDMIAVKKRKCHTSAMVWYYVHAGAPAPAPSQ